MGEEKRKRQDAEKIITDLREQKTNLINECNNLKNTVKDLQHALSQYQQSQQQSSLNDESRTGTPQLPPQIPNSYQDHAHQRWNSVNSVGSLVGSASSTNTSPLSTHGTNNNVTNHNIDV